MGKYTRADREFAVKFVNSERWKNLHAEMRELAKGTQKKQRALAKAEEDDMAWEMVKMGCKPIRQGLLFK
jgi:hypothetical protein